MNGDAGPSPDTAGHSDVRLSEFAALEPWELQQVDHADYFILRLCAGLQRAAGEVRGSCAAGGPINRKDVGEMCSQVSHLVRYMKARPELVGRALRKLPLLGVPDCPGEEPELVLHLLRRHSPICLLTDWQVLLAREPPPDGVVQEATLDDFAGDAVDLLPFGWTDALNGRPTNWFADAFYDIEELPGIMEPLPPGEEDVLLPPRYVQVAMWRGAGFTLWDRKRVEALKTLVELSSLRTGWVRIGWSFA
jgi:hypothetical protein